MTEQELRRAIVERARSGQEFSAWSLMEELGIYDSETNYKLAGWLKSAAFAGIVEQTGTALMRRPQSPEAWVEGGRPQYYSSSKRIKQYRGTAALRESLAEEVS